MDLIKLILIFAVIVIFLKFKRPLWLAALVDCVLMLFLYRLDFRAFLLTAGKSAIGKSTLSMVFLLYLVTLLQRLLDYKKDIISAQKAMSSLAGNRRLNVMLAPLFVGLLPSASASYIAGDIVSATVGDDLPKDMQACMTGYFRHIPESFLPTFSGIMLALSITGVKASSFLVSMLIPVCIMLFSGYIWYVRKLDPDTGMEPSANRFADLVTIVKRLWTILFIVAAILIFNVDTWLVVLAAIVLYTLISRIPFQVLIASAKSAVEPKILINTFCIMIFKDILTLTGAAQTLPEIFSRLPIPTTLIFVLLMFVCTIISGSAASTALLLPLAWAAVPEGGILFLALLMSVAFSASQLSPTHICLLVVSEYYHVPFGDYLKREIPLSMTVLICVTVLYYAVTAFLPVL